MPEHKPPEDRDIVFITVTMAVERRWAKSLEEAIYQATRDHGAKFTKQVGQSDPEKLQTQKLDRAILEPRRPDEPRRVPTAFLRLSGETKPQR